MATKIGQGGYVPDISTFVQNCITIRLGDFASHICEVAYVHSASFFGGWGSSNSLPPIGRCADFDDQYVKRRRFAQGCAFWGPRAQILHIDPIFAKTRKFLVDF